MQWEELNVATRMLCPRSGMVLDVWRMKRSSTRAGLLIMVWLWRLYSTFIDIAVLHGS